MVAALLLLLLLWPVMLIAFVAASLDTRQNGFFVQQRVGRYGKLFPIVKLRTMRTIAGMTTTVTQAHDPRITRLGQLWRRSKIDELPQLFNVLLGQMSFVGPRPDVPGFADELQGEDRIILSIRPGITGPATLAFRDEQELLARQANPERYNLEVIFPQKVALNRAYVENYSFWRDMEYIWLTISGGRPT